MEKIKILGIIGDKNQSASKKFRVEIPLKALEDKIVKIGEEDFTISTDFIDSFEPPLEVLENYNIIWSNMGSLIKPAAIGYLQAKGIKFVQDVDDYFLIQKNHIQLSRTGYYCFVKKKSHQKHFLQYLVKVVDSICLF